MRCCLAMVYLHIALLLLLFPNCNLYRTRGNPFSAVDCWARLLKDGANNQTTNKRSATAAAPAAVWLFIYLRQRSRTPWATDLSIQGHRKEKKNPGIVSRFIYVDSLIELRYIRA